MKSTHTEELYIKKNNLTNSIFDEKSIFFDIETTGFSPSSSSIYMIGCARRKGNLICIDQFFAETPDEEKVILSAFIELIKQYSTIISYNGVGFDIPFIKAKCKKYNLSESFKKYNYLDIFKSVSTIKFLLKLENYKQKSIEKFLGLKRNDKFSGGELINVYYEYMKEPSDDKLELLYLHNYEDVLGMTELIPILSYIELLNGQYTITETNISNYTDYNKTQRNEFLITLQNDYVLPQKVSTRNDIFHIVMNTETTVIRIPIIESQLKFFYSNYKDYYYLPAEDNAIHKSVASFVDSEYKEKCHAYNCYTKKQSMFLPQTQSIMHPEFKKEYKDKITYFELTEDFSSSDIMLRRYVNHIFKYMLKSK